MQVLLPLSVVAVAVFAAGWSRPRWQLLGELAVVALLLAVGGLLLSALGVDDEEAIMPAGLLLALVFIALSPLAAAGIAWRRRRLGA